MAASAFLSHVCTVVNYIYITFLVDQIPASVIFSRENIWSVKCFLVAQGTVVMARGLYSEAMKFLTNLNNIINQKLNL